MNRNILGSDSNFKDEFLLGAAKAFFCSAYAEYVKGLDANDQSLYAQPGPGEDWADHLPDIPLYAYVLAGMLWKGTQVLWRGRDGIWINHPPLAAQQAAAADGVLEVNATDFGFSLAMMAMDTGVSWFDNHAEFPLKIDRIECNSLSFDPSTYAPKL